MKEAELMLNRAREDADALTRRSEVELKAVLDSRMKQALDKIAREEELAIQEVRNHVVDIALAAARAVIVTHVGKLPQEELIKLALADIERKIHLCARCIRSASFFLSFLFYSIPDLSKPAPGYNRKAKASSFSTDFTTRPTNVMTTTVTSSRFPATARAKSTPTSNTA